MNGLEKSINELINMSVQYEATIKKSAPSVLIGEASTSKAIGKRAGRWKRKKGKAKAKTVIVTKDAKSAAVAPVEWTRERRGWVLSSSRGQTISAPIAVRKGIGRGVVPIYLPIKIWHARLGHISQDRMKRLVDSKSLEIDNLDNLPAYVCGPLNTQARGGFSYFITFTDDHSRYGYVYLMRYKSDAFVRFKEFRLEVENQTVAKLKPFDRTEGYALETAARLLNIAPSKTVAQTPYQIWHGKPASYKYLRVWGSLAYIRRLVGDKLDSRSSLCRFIGYPKETAGYYFYDPIEQRYLSQGMQCSWKEVFQQILDADEI
ncbi:UNVERIFIED_CONTAM: hypothetical protein Sangu_3121000 [Sesamum angustifolium]|uniref:Uncharacterized protein n=1 Tax=Sesamum angustifolium TaxID=2727405 RepID=A0AAW2K360_9LAMI